MPIINGFFSVWNLAYISVPSPTANADNRVSWSTPRISVVKSLEFKQISLMDVANNISKGSPYGTVWKSEDTIWQTDISMPFLVPAHGIDQSPAGLVENQNLPLCANLPVESLSGGFPFSVATSRFIWAALTSIWGHDTTKMSFRLRDWSGGFDGLIQRCSMEIGEDGSFFTISILSSMDPRTYFYLTNQLPSQNTISTMRVARAWDFSIKSDIEVLGSPSTRYEPIIGDVPNRMVNLSSTSDGLPAISPSGSTMMFNGRYVAIKSCNLSIESSIDRIPSAGVGSSRPIFSIRSIKSSGSIDLVPYVVWSDMSQKAISLTSIGGKPPEGWAVDSQSLEEISRYGGQFFVTGRPDYEGNAKPLYFEVGMRNGLPPSPMEPKFLLINRETLGPISLATISLRPNAGDMNILRLEFNTSPNVNRSDPNIFNRFTKINNQFPPV